MNELFREHKIYVDFSHASQMAVFDGKRNGCIKNIPPVNRLSKSGKRKYDTMKEVAENYDSIFNENVISAVKHQRIETFFVNYRGLGLAGVKSGIPISAMMKSVRMSLSKLSL